MGAGFDARFARFVARVQEVLQTLEGEFFVAVLRPVFCGNDRKTRGQVGCAHGGFNFVAVLTAWAGCAQGLKLNILEECGGRHWKNYCTARSGEARTAKGFGHGIVALRFSRLIGLKRGHVFVFSGLPRFFLNSAHRERDAFLPAVDFSDQGFDLLTD